ncbi:MotA/TolQ/ExbB proton channel family protein [Vibrio sp. HN007]|uniref:MotA/TolQ/ExbB proton channel family protein n=1 Tax=Vibrio iocasae TaxID=3098914 RepID=UPI0035D427A6
MQTFSVIHSQLGIMTWPLTTMSLLAMLIILERCFYLLINTKTNSRKLISHLYSIDLNNKQAFDELLQRQSRQKNTLAQGVTMLLNHRHFEKSLREDTVSVWLEKKRQQYSSGLRFLTIIGVISPLVGLLGTVLGLIEMFKGLAHTSGAIAPSDLASGLGLAMSTTAAGLIIALPAISGSHILQIWADRSIGKIEHALNHCNLYLEGITFDSKPSQVKCKRAPSGVCDNGSEATAI